MKNLFKQRLLRRFAVVALAFSPVALLTIPGCSGGSSGLSKPSAPATVTIPGSLLLLGQGQSAALALLRKGQAVTGTVTISNIGVVPVAAKSTAAVTVQIPLGTYNLTGTFDEDGGFRLSGNFPAPLGTFIFSGVYPTQTSAGNFSLTVGGETVTGTIPALSGTVPTTSPTTNPTTSATSKPTASPTVGASATPAPTAVSGISRLESISFTKGAGFNGFGVNISLPLTGQTPTFSNATQFSASNIRLGGDNNILFEGPFLNRPARVGDTFALGNRSAATGILYYQEPGNKNWESTGGTLRITAASAKSVTFTLTNVAFSPQSFGTTTATGNFTLSSNGVLSGS